jgi:hypothetical protein
MDQKKQIKLECIFCGSSNFEVPYQGYQPKENENIKCSNCNQLNIYEDLLEIAKEKGYKEVKEDIENEFKTMFQSIKF